MEKNITRCDFESNGSIYPERLGDPKREMLLSSMPQEFTDPYSRLAKLEKKHTSLDGRGDCISKKQKARRGRRIKIKKFVQQCLEQGIFSPTEMAYEYNNLYGLKGDKTKHRTAFTKAMRRLGISAKDRLNLKRESVKEENVTDITEYPEVQRYLGFSDMAQIGNHQKQATVTQLRIL